MTKKKFLELYKKLSKEERDTIVLYYGSEPYTWNPIWVEVINDTKMSKELLRVFNLALFSHEPPPTSLGNITK